MSGWYGKLERSLPLRCERGSVFFPYRLLVGGGRLGGWRVYAGGCGQRGKGLIMFATGQASP